MTGGRERLRALMLAAPGAGKGTQGELLSQAYGVAHLATGDLLRQHVADATDIGRAAKAYMDRGELVPDLVVLDLVLDGVFGTTPLDGFVLDGFPRTLDQAEAAYAWASAHDLTFNAVVELEVDPEELVRRLLERGRRSGRGDDNEVTIRERLRVFAEKTEPLLDFYGRRGILVEVDGEGSVDEVFARVVAGVEALGIVVP